jgi:hypothetical protein
LPTPTARLLKRRHQYRATCKSAVFPMLQPASAYDDDYREAAHGRTSLCERRLPRLLN